MSGRIDEIVFGKAQTELFRRVKRLEVPGSDVIITDTRNNNEQIIQTPLTEDEVRAIAGELINELTTPKEVTYDDITATGNPTVTTGSQTFTDRSYKEFVMFLIGKNNTGTFTSATVTLETSEDGTNWEPAQMTLSITNGDPVYNDTFEFNANYVRPNVTAISVSGDADLDIRIKGII